MRGKPPERHGILQPVRAHRACTWRRPGAGGDHNRGRVGLYFVTEWQLAAFPNAQLAVLPGGGAGACGVCGEGGWLACGHRATSTCSCRCALGAGAGPI